MVRQQDIEEILSIIWEAEERGDTTASKIESKTKELQIETVFYELAKENLITVKGNKIMFTDAGRTLAKDITRRQRLAERLLYDVLEVESTESDSQACAFEHIISKEVEQSICTLLGHPRVCPHGSEIPAGECCQQAGKIIESIVRPLEMFKAGERGKIMYILTKDHPQLHKLMSLGITPGTVAKVHQVFPSFVVQVGETQIALENEVAKSIYLKKM